MSPARAKPMSCGPSSAQAGSGRERAAEFWDRVCQLSHEFMALPDTADEPRLKE
jgi:hypothetical protein